MKERTQKSSVSRTRLRFTRNSNQSIHKSKCYHHLPTFSICWFNSLISRFFSSIFARYSSMPLCAFKNACCTKPEFDCSMCGKHSTPKFCMICLICCSKYITSAWSFVLCFARSHGTEKTRLSVERRFEGEDERSRTATGRDDVSRDHFPGCRVSGVGVLFHLRFLITRERGERDLKKEKENKRRTMETSFVVSAAFWAPVVTESQNDMAVFLASKVWTEMVANFCDATRPLL